jgi:ribosomal protein L7/L12
MITLLFTSEQAREISANSSLFMKILIENLEILQSAHPNTSYREKIEAIAIAIRRTYPRWADTQTQKILAIKLVREMSARLNIPSLQSLVDAKNFVENLGSSTLKKEIIEENDEEPFPPDTTPNANEEV